jgi:hypothetical protein
MAALYLLLQHNPAVRSVAELAPVVDRHNAWIQGKKFLLITYYMLSAKTMESHILGEYVNQVQRLHPGSKLPGVFLAESMFRDAQNQPRRRSGRFRMGRDRWGMGRHVF